MDYVARGIKSWLKRQDRLLQKTQAWRDLQVNGRRRRLFNFFHNRLLWFIYQRFDAHMQNFNSNNAGMH